MSVVWEPESLDKTSAQARQFADVLERLDQALRRVQTDSLGLNFSATIGRSTEALRDFGAQIDKTFDSATKLAAVSDGIASKATAISGASLTPPGESPEAAGGSKEGEEHQDLLKPLGEGLKSAREALKRPEKETAEHISKPEPAGQTGSKSAKQTLAHISKPAGSRKAGSKSAKRTLAHISEPSGGRKAGRKADRKAHKEAPEEVVEKVPKKLAAEASPEAAGGGMTGLLDGALGAAGSLVAIEEAAFSAADALGDIISKSEEEHQQQLQTLRVLGSSDPEAERGHVLETANSLGYAHSELFDVLQSEDGLKIGAGEDPEKAAKDRTDVAAGALGFSGGSVTGAQNLMAGLNQASQTGNFDELRSSGFEKVLEQQEHLTPQQAQAVLAPGSDPKAIQHSLQIVEQALIDLSNVKAPDSLPRELKKTHEGLDDLISGNGFPTLTAAFQRLSTMLSSKEMVPVLMAVDTVLAAVVDILNVAIYIILEFVKAINFVIQTVDDFIKRHPTLAHIAGFDSDKGNSSDSPHAALPASRTAGSSQPLLPERVQVPVAIQRSHPQQDLDHPAARGATRNTSHIRSPHASLSISRIEINTYVSGDTNPEEIARHTAHLVPIELSAFMEQLQYMKEGTS